MSPSGCTGPILVAVVAVRRSRAAIVALRLKYLRTCDEALGGAISVHSPLGAGTSLRVELPLDERQTTG